MEESKKPAAATSDDKDVSLNTMLDDSNLSFNPDAAMARKLDVCEAVAPKKFEGDFGLFGMFGIGFAVFFLIFLLLLLILHPVHS